MMKLSNNYMKNKKIKNIFITILLFLLILLSSFMVDVNIISLFEGSPKMLNLIARMLRPDFFYFQKIIPAILDTFEITLIASVLGTFISIPVSILISKKSPFNKKITALISTILAFLRTIPTLIWAAFLVSMFSVGKFSGIIATLIIACLIGTRLLVEHIDNISENKIYSIKSTGANSFQILLYCIIPEIEDNIISVFFILLESCLRSAAVLGLVGAGGIGQVLWTNLNMFKYDNVATIILVLFLSIYCMDIVSLKVRKKLNSNILKENKNQDRKLQEKNFQNKKIRKKVFHLFIFIFVIYLSVKPLAITRERFLVGLTQGKYILVNLFKPDFSYSYKLIEGLSESLGIAIFATIFGAILSFIMVRFTAINLNHSKIISYGLKALANVFRTFPPMITAIIFFRGVGPGPLAGALSLSLYTAGVMTKIYSESVENINENILNSLRSTGATNSQIYIRGVFPESISTFFSLLLYRMESNIRNSTILGLIGAGGIGTSLSMNIQWRNWNKVGLLLLGSSLMIILFDIISRQIRNKLGK